MRIEMAILCEENLVEEEPVLGQSLGVYVFVQSFILVDFILVLVKKLAAQLD